MCTKAYAGQFDDFRSGSTGYLSLYGRRDQSLLVVIERPSSANIRWLTQHESRAGCSLDAWVTSGVDPALAFRSNGRLSHWIEEFVRGVLVRVGVDETKL